MAMVILALVAIVAIAELVCFVMVVIKMFQNGDTGLGIASIVLFPCVGIGGLIAFIMGWVNSAKYGVKNIMMAWTGLFVLMIILQIVSTVVSR